MFAHVRYLVLDKCRARVPVGLMHVYVGVLSHLLCLELWVMRLQEIC